MTRPRLLDLFCGGGGGAVGYQRAGFYVVGVDIRPQPNYAGDEFHRADALDVLAAGAPTLIGDYVQAFDGVHASPPCNWASALNRAVGNRDEHENLIPPTRALLREYGLPYVIENVPSARPCLPDAFQLCGVAFGLEVVRHRIFETNFPVLIPPCAHKPGGAADGTYVMFGGRSPRANGRRRPPRASEREWRDEAGLGFLTIRDSRLAIPPAMTEHIGHYLMAEIKARGAA